MELEKQRGISVSSTVLQFEYGGCCVNLLDTPGHRDFSEDTYRVLTAADSAVMVVDAAKGIEAQTLKLFEICRKRGVPIFVFINKLDRPSRPPLELIDELEKVLGLAPAPLNWPLGDGPRFRGIYNREKREVHLFERTAHGAYRSPVKTGGIDDDALLGTVDEAVLAQARADIELLDVVTEPLDMEQVLAGRQMPIFFGSAMNNFGVQFMLDSFLQLAPPPSPRKAVEREVFPDESAFSGFVFKIQANMNPKHRDRAAYIRIVSGVFERDMNVIHTRTGKKIRLSNSQRLFAQDRETVDAAYPGDVVALVGNYDFHIGDTLAQEAQLHFREIPRFAPECFSYVRSHLKSPPACSAFRCSARWARCSSKCCNTGSRTNTARRAGLNRHHGTASAGCGRKVAARSKNNRRCRCRRAARWPAMCSGIGWSFSPMPGC